LYVGISQVSQVEPPKIPRDNVESRIDIWTGPTKLFSVIFFKFWTGPEILFPVVFAKFWTGPEFLFSVLFSKFWTDPDTLFSAVLF
jgi:hypothetical protein